MPAPRDPQRPFERDAFFDDPGIVGARWWNRAFDAQAATSRRNVTIALAAIGAIFGLTVIASTSSGGGHTTWRRALDLQREIGWNVGAYDDPLVFPWATTGAEDGRTPLSQIVATVGAKRHAPFQVLTRLDALGATPTGRVAEDAYVVADLRDRIRPGRSAPMEADRRAGQTFARIFAGKDLGVFVIADLEGARSIAFAAGACTAFEPVLVLDNWPHPAGAVPAHGPLGALAAYQPELAAGAATRGAQAPPLLVLERERCCALHDPAATFDNRYFATLPTAGTLTRWSFRRVLLIVASAYSLPEAPDVGEALKSYAAAGLDVRALPLDMFDASGGYPGGDGAFFHHFPWAPAAGTAPAPLVPSVATWRPGGPSADPSPTQRPEHYGEIEILAREGTVVSVPYFGGTRARASGGSGG